MGHYFNNFKRFWEVDFLRGLAVFMMFIFHFLFYIDFFGIKDISLYSGGFLIFQRIIPIIFITMAGVSVTILAKNSKKKKVFLHGFNVFSVALIITVVTNIFFHEKAVLFGILHLIGLCIIIGAFFFRYKILNLVLAILSGVVGLFYISQFTSPSWLFWIGIRPIGFSSFDYYPLFPWIGLMFLGLFLGNIFYSGNFRKIYFFERISWISDNSVSRSICYLGRYSLIFYVVHIPVLFGVVYLLTFIM